MKMTVIITIIVAVSTIGGVLAYFMFSQPGPAQSSGFAYICVGYSPGPLLAVQLAESGQYQSSITYQGQTLCVGARLNAQQMQYLRNLTAASPQVGSSKAKVVVLEYLDPTCPYCALFDVDYGDIMSQYIANGTVLYAVRFLPTHLLGYEEQGSYPPFAAGIDTWLGLTCIYNRSGGEEFYRALNMIYRIAISYLETGNSTAMYIYPLAQFEYIKYQYPQCAINATTSQLLALIQNANSATAAEARRLGIPDYLLSTPLFIVYRN
jgi:hypothetical protein